MWTSSCDRPLEVSREPLVELLYSDARSLVRSDGVREPERSRNPGEPGTEKRGELGASCVQIRAERRHLRRPRLHGVEAGLAGPHPAQRGVSLRNRTRVRGGDLRAARKDSPEHPVEICAADDRAALNHRETLGREGERGQTSAKLFCASQCGTVQAHLLGRTRREVDLRLEGAPCRLTDESHPCRFLIEADEPRLRAGAWRETL